MKTVFILSDSFRRDHLGIYNPGMYTPHLDQLARTSCVFDNMYAGSFPTGPNRRDIHLGRGPAPGSAFNPWKNFESDEVPFAHRLYEQGICNMMITDVANGSTHGANMFKGFRYYLVNRGQEGDGYWCDQDVELRFDDVPHALTRYHPDTYHRILINRTNRRIEDDYFSPKTFRLACEWLERNWRRDDFFLWVEAFDPHEPWDPPSYYIDRYDPDYNGRTIECPPYGFYEKLGITDREIRHVQARYAASCTMVDFAVGRLLSTLDKLNILDETAVFFTSDHGIYAGFEGDAGLVCKPWRINSEKGAMLIGGDGSMDHVQWLPLRTGTMRIPLMIKMPHQQQQRRIERITQPWDLAPTILDLYKLEKPDSPQGESLLPLIQGQSAALRTYAYNGHHMNGHMAQVINHEWIYSCWPKEDQEPWLIDLKNDPAQVRNVAGDKPEVCHELHELLVAYNRAEMG